MPTSGIAKYIQLSAALGSRYYWTDGVADVTLYLKESGFSNSGSRHGVEIRRSTMYDWLAWF